MAKATFLQIKAKNSINAFQNVFDDVRKSIIKMH